MRARKLPGRELEKIYSELQANISAELKREQWQGRATFERSADVRYRGQGYELTLTYGADLIDRFHAEHHRRYGYANPEREVEIVTLRLRGRVASPERLSKLKIEKSSGKLKSGASRVFFEGRRIKTPVMPRETLKTGRAYRGPAIITEYSATTVIPPGFSFKADKAQNLLVDVV
jgi:N-methylhydantoinase A